MNRIYYMYIRQAVWQQKTLDNMFNDLPSFFKPKPKQSYDELDVYLTADIMNITDALTSGLSIVTPISYCLEWPLIICSSLVCCYPQASSM